MTKLAVASTVEFPEAWTERLMEGLNGAGLEVEVWSQDQGPSDAPYLLAWYAPLGCYDQFPKAKALFSFGAGVDHFLRDPDLPDLPIIKGATDDLANRMAEYITLQALAVHRRSPEYQANQRAHRWLELGQKPASRVTIGFLGFGWIGQHAAKPLRALGFNIRGWSRTPKQIEGAESFSGQDGLAPFLAGTDILVCLLPLTDETRNILNADLFAGLPPRASIIHVGRGEQLVADDLIAALDTKHLYHAVLDVFPQEPLPSDSPLWDHPKITVTPHVAAATDPAALGPHIRAEIDRIEQGHAPLHAIDRSRGY